MSTRFLLFSCACAGVALTGGYGLGLYATTSPRAAVETPLPQAAMVEGDAPSDLNGPALVECKGCGPTLADRQMAANMAGWDGMNDPVVRDYTADYVTQDDAMQADYGAPPAPVPTSPASIEGFAAGEGEGNWGSVKVARAPDSKTPAGEAPADAVVPY